MSTDNRPSQGFATANRKPPPKKETHVDLTQTTSTKDNLKHVNWPKVYSTLSMNSANISSDHKHYLNITVKGLEWLKENKTQELDFPCEEHPLELLETLATNLRTICETKEGPSGLSSNHLSKGFTGFSIKQKIKNSPSEMQEIMNFYEAYRQYKLQTTENQDYDDYIGSYIASPKKRIISYETPIEPVAETLRMGEMDQYTSPLKLVTRFDHKSMGQGEKIDTMPFDHLVHRIESSKTKNKSGRAESAETQPVENTNSVIDYVPDIYQVNPDTTLEIGILREPVYGLFHDKKWTQDKIRGLSKRRRRIIIDKPIKPLNDLARQIDSIPKENLMTSVSIKSELKDFINNKLAPDIILDRLQEVED
jgi:hypothetical protein